MSSPPRPRPRPPVRREERKRRDAKNLVCFMLLAFDTGSNGPGRVHVHLYLFRSPRARRALRLYLLQEVRPCCCMISGLRGRSVSAASSRIALFAATALSRVQTVLQQSRVTSRKLCRAGAASTASTSAAWQVGDRNAMHRLELATRRVFCNTARLAQTQPSRELLLQEYETGRWSGRLNATISE